MKWKIVGVIGVVVSSGICFVAGINEAGIVGIVGAVVGLGLVIKAIFFPSEA